MRGCLLLLGPVVAVLAFATMARADGTIVLPRPGQVGVSLQGQYGTMFKAGEIGDTFDSGAGLAVRLRYRMRYERALGLSFERQSFDARDDTPDSTFAPTELTVVTSGVEIYQMFGTRTRTVRMLSAGVGLAQLSYETFSGETEFPGDGLYVSVGAGLERFFWQSWAYDLGFRYMALFHDGETNHELQASAGVIFYVSY